MICQLIGKKKSFHLTILQILMVFFNYFTKYVYVYLEPLSFLRSWSVSLTRAVRISITSESLWSRLPGGHSVIVPRVAWTDDFFVTFTFHATFFFFFFSLTVMSGAIIAINHLIIYAPLEWMPFFSVLELSTGLFMFVIVTPRHLKWPTSYSKTSVWQ